MMPREGPEPPELSVTEVIDSLRLLQFEQPFE